MPSGKAQAERKKNFLKILRVSKLDLAGKVWTHWRKRIMCERNKRSRQCFLYWSCKPQKKGAYLIPGNDWRISMLFFFQQTVSFNLSYTFSHILYLSLNILFSWLHCYFCSFEMLPHQTKPKVQLRATAF